MENETVTRLVARLGAEVWVGEGALLMPYPPTFPGGGHIKEHHWHGAMYEEYDQQIESYHEELNLYTAKKREQFYEPNLGVREKALDEIAAMVPDEIIPHLFGALGSHSKVKVEDVYSDLEKRGMIDETYLVGLAVQPHNTLDRQIALRILSQRPCQDDTIRRIRHYTKPWNLMYSEMETKYATKIVPTRSIDEILFWSLIGASAVTGFCAYINWIGGEIKSLQSIWLGSVNVFFLYEGFKCNFGWRSTSDVIDSGNRILKKYLPSHLYK